MADALPYTVRSQIEHEMLEPGGELVKVMTVTFQTPAGVIATVDVPLSMYSTANVDQAIQAKVQAIEAVHALGQPSAPLNP